MNQSMNQSIDLSINQSMDCYIFGHFSFKEEEAKKHKTVERKTSHPKNGVDYCDVSTDDEAGPSTSTSNKKHFDDGNKKNLSSDRMEFSEDDGALPELVDLFTGKTFLLYGTLDSVMRRTLTRYLTAYDGAISEYMDENVDFVVTDDKWDDNFDEVMCV